MVYIYDILLNFNKNLYEYYEWEKKDNIVHIKKIPIFKVTSNVLNDILTKNIKIDNSFFNIILNKCEIFDKKRIKCIKYACLFTDSYKIIGVKFQENEILLSDLLLDEADDSCSISNRCKLFKLEYNILGDKNIEYFKTRNEIKIKNKLIEEINNIYNNKEYGKLKYLYFEYFNKYIENIDDCYNELLNSLEDINCKHLNLFNLIELYHKMTSNLTN